MGVVILKVSMLDIRVIQKPEEGEQRVTFICIQIKNRHSAVLVS